MASVTDPAPASSPEPPQLADLLERDPYLAPYREHIAARSVIDLNGCSANKM